MPQNTALCRICLATDRPVFTIADTPLQGVYEKITSTPLNTADFRPVVVCFICCADLKKCLKLMLICAKAENMLARILYRHPNATRSSKKLLTLVKRKTNGLCNSLRVTPVDCTDTLLFNTPIVIKKEPEEQQDIVNMKTEIEFECDVPPQISHLTPELDTDNVLNLRDAVVLKTIRMEQECYGYQMKVESVKEEYWQEATETVKEEQSEEVLTDDMKLITSNPQIERKPLLQHEDLLQHSGFHVTENVPVKKSIPEKPKQIDKSSGRYFECNECQRRFNRKCTLETHMQLHSGPNRRYLSCNICNHRLSTKPGLDRHMMTHTGEKPHACHLCPRRFIEKGTLIRHIRTHTGEKPYECDVCERGFKQLNDLKRHARIHTGEKPFKCDICQRRFNERSKVTRHSKKHYGEKLTKRDFLKLCR